jgi:RNA polymerase I-specific transcription initiation factor RRN3
MDAIVAKCLEVDVEIVIEESGDVLIRKDEESGGLFDDADDDDDLFALDDNHDGIGGGTTGGNSSKFPRGTIGSALKIRDDVTEMADKLDSMLCVLLNYVLERITSPATQDKMFTQFFNIFESRILSTYKSKFVQYIIFVICKNYPQRGKYNRYLCGLFFNTSFLIYMSLLPPCYRNKFC